MSGGERENGGRGRGKRISKTTGLLLFSLSPTRPFANAKHRKPDAAPLATVGEGGADPDTEGRSIHFEGVNDTDERGGSAVVARRGQGRRRVADVSREPSCLAATPDGEGSGSAADFRGACSPETASSLRSGRRERMWVWACGRDSWANGSRLVSGGSVTAFHDQTSIPPTLTHQIQCRRRHPGAVACGGPRPGLPRGAAPAAARS